MSWTLAEGAVNSLKTYFENNAAAKLSALQTEYGDGILLPKPVSWETAEKVFSSVSQFPLAVILVPDTSVPQWTGVEVLGTHNVVVAVVLMEQDSDKLQKKLYRYGRMLLELLSDAHGDPSVTFHVGVGEVTLEFSPLFTDPQSRFVADVRMNAELVLKETR